MNGLPAAAPPAASPTAWRWWVCVMLLLASTLNYMDRMALNQTAVRIKAAFGLDDVWYGVLESVFVIGFAVGTLTTGWLVDRVGVRRVYPAVVVGWSLFGFLTGFAPGYWVLLGCRFGLGAFEAGNWPCGIRTVRQVMPPAERSLGSAFFQNGTALGAVVTPGIVWLCLTWVGPDDPRAWQVPFRVIGVIGLVWVALWVFTVPPRVLQQVNEPLQPAAVSTPFSALFADRRYWLLVAMVLAVNTSWHTFRVWMPLFLQTQHGYTEAEMSVASTAYYLLAEAGAWGVGLGSIALARVGLNIFQSRATMFALCAGLVLTAVALPYLTRGPVLIAVLMAYGFGAFGLFPTYFAFSQDLSGRHQGKVTGTLGAINAVYLAGMYFAEGKVAKALGSYDTMMAYAGLPAVAALLLLVLFWPKTDTPALTPPRAAV